jgi:predicted Holliday junction resolvase-like endonuclease
MFSYFAFLRKPRKSQAEMVELSIDVVAAAVSEAVAFFFEDFFHFPRGVERLYGFPVFRWQN